MKTSIQVWTLMLCGMLLTCVKQTDTLQQELQTYIESQNADIGVAVIIDDADTISVNCNRQYEMNSVMKLFQAAGVVYRLQEMSVSLDDSLYVEPSQWMHDTWSPLTKEYDISETVLITYRKLLAFSLQQSDNNACDLLFRHVVSVEWLQAWLTRAGCRDVNIVWTEAQMHDRPARSADNNITPLAAASFINQLFTSHFITGDGQQAIIQMLNGCTTGTGRIPKPLQNTGATCGHKTGTGLDAPDGTARGINDVGFVTLPNGRHYALAVFVPTSNGNIEQAEHMIADISEIVYRHITAKP